VPETEDCGCDEFAALADVADDGSVDLHPDPRGTTVRKWSGLIAPYGVPTGDGRRFAAQALTSRELPAPVKWQRTDAQGHTSSVVVGRIDHVHFADDGVHAEGIFFTPDPERLPRLAEDANEAYTLTKEKVIGPSVDLDAMEFHPLEEDGADFAADGRRPEIEVTAGRISAITLVPIPAFAEARPFSLEDVDADEYASKDVSLTAAGVREGMEALPVLADGSDWDLMSWLLDEQTDGALYASGDVVLFPVAQAGEDGMYRLHPGAVADAISVLAFQSDAVDLPEGTKDALRASLETLAAECDLPNPPWAQDALVASAGLARTVLPAAAFADPKLTGPTPLRFDQLADGSTRVSGHVATWRTCHIGYQDRCVTAPKSRSGYAYFHVGEVLTDQGALSTGKITMGGGHADTRSGFQAAADHYDRTSAAVADVRAGEDKFGIWVSGVVRPGVSATQLAEFAASPLSGDWRRVGGAMEMVAALAVNVPGFPVPRVATDRRGDLALVAAGVVTEFGSAKFDKLATKVGSPALAGWITNHEPAVKARAEATRAKHAAKRAARMRGKDNDGDHDYSVDEVADAVYARMLAGRAEELERAEAVELFASLTSDLATLDQLELSSAAAVFEE